MRHTKIIATLGPASSDEQVIAGLLGAGADVVRLNFSHGTHAEHAARFATVRRISAEWGRQVAVLQDLSGPKIRTGRLPGGNPIDLVAGGRLIIEVGDATGEPGRVFTTYAPLARAVSAGDRLLLDDGHIELEVESADGRSIVTRVVDGGPLGEHKGINAPQVPLPAAGVTEKDAADLAFGLALGVDLVALSFVQSRTDLDQARAITAREGRPDVALVAKLERPEAIDRLDEILDAADAVMVARGDLGLEIPLERVPRVQKEILRRARHRSVPVIIATQVLESMRLEGRPTRAEVNDAASAVEHGTDAIMLSGETASGLYPVRTVEVLADIIGDAESLPGRPEPPAAGAAGDHATALCDAAVRLAGETSAHAIVAVTREGRTARQLSALRPEAAIYALTDRDEVARRLALWWGVVPLVMSIEGDVDTVATRAIERIQHAGTLVPGATVVVVNATPDLDKGAANFLRVRRA